MHGIYIEQITQELTWNLRREVLYPERGATEMAMPEDDDGTHFGAFTNNRLVAVVSVFNKGDDFQFRKFAVAAHVQGQGVGRALLSYIEEDARQHGGKRLWCNARDTAIGFYTRHGFVLTGQVFQRHGFNYHIMEKSLV